MPRLKTSEVDGYLVSNPVLGPCQECGLQVEAEAATFRLKGRGQGRHVLVTLCLPCLLTMVAEVLRNRYPSDV